MAVNGHEVQIKAIRSDGAEWYYNSDDWGITGLTGLDSSPVEIFRSNKGFGDGSFITGKRKGEREIQIVAKCKTLHNNTENRARCIAFHNSNYEYKLEITYLGNTKVASKCEILAFKLPTGNIYGRLELTIDYLSPEPDLSSEERYSADTATFSRLWHANYAYVAGSKLPHGTASKNTEHNIFYSGSEKAPIEIRIYFYNKVTNPLHVSVNGKELTSYDGLKNPSQFVKETNLWLSGISHLVGMQVGDDWTTLVNNYYDENLFLRIGDNIIKVWDDAGQNDYNVLVNYEGRYGGI